MYWVTREDRTKFMVLLWKIPQINDVLADTGEPGIAISLGEGSRGIGQLKV